LLLALLISLRKFATYLLSAFAPLLLQIISLPGGHVSFRLFIAAFFLNVTPLACGHWSFLLLPLLSLTFKLLTSLLQLAMYLLCAFASFFLQITSLSRGHSSFSFLIAAFFFNIAPLSRGHLSLLSEN
jgi:hypothetical protein